MLAEKNIEELEQTKAQEKAEENYNKTLDTVDLTDIGQAIDGRASRPASSEDAARGAKGTSRGLRLWFW